MLKKEYLEEFITYLRFPSISTDSAHNGDVTQCAEWLSSKLSRIGLKSAIHKTPGHPIVLARNDHKPGRPTVMIYGHYDVQPVDPVSLWSHDPFEPHIEGGIVTARGATDNKGQNFAHILGVEETLRERGDLPVNLIFLIEGEEEIGSLNLLNFITARQEELKCDVIAISDTSMIAEGVPTLTYGLRGIAAVEVKVTGPAMDLHSGMYGGAIINPVTALARLVATFHDEKGKVSVKGFYDDVRPLESWEQEVWGKLPFGDDTLISITKVPELGGEPDFTSIERLWARPTAEVNGFYGGYQGEGTKTVLPKEATVKFTFRLVPDQNPKDIETKVVAHLKKHCPPSVRMEITPGHHGDSYLVDPHAGYGMAAQKALGDTFDHKPVALIREGGSIPIVNDFKRILGADTLLIGLGLPDCNAHSPNETFPLVNLEKGIQLNKNLLREIAEQAKK